MLFHLQTTNLQFLPPIYSILGSMFHPNWKINLVSAANRMNRWSYSSMLFRIRWKKYSKIKQQPWLECLQFNFVLLLINKLNCRNSSHELIEIQIHGNAFRICCRGCYWFYLTTELLLSLGTWRRRRKKIGKILTRKREKKQRRGRPTAALAAPSPSGQRKKKKSKRRNERTKIKLRGTCSRRWASRCGRDTMCLVPNSVE